MAYVDSLALQATTARALSVCVSVPAGCASGAQPTGLVPSKTSPFEISLDPKQVRIKRIKRLKRSVWSAGHLHGIADAGHRPWVAHFVTLTYVGVDDWRADHISAATEQYRRHCARLGIACRYLWVAELQKRGAVHYHLLAWLPVGVRMPFWDRTTTSNGRTVKPFWSHGMTNTEQARSGVGYLMKYLSKLDGETAFPPHLRLYGVGGLSAQARGVRAWYNLPEWAKREHGVGELKRLGSRLIVVDTGEVCEPVFARSFQHGTIRLTLLRDMPERWHDGAYSSVQFNP